MMLHTMRTIYPLHRFGFICLNGEKTAEFLQGQLTCDIHNVHPKQGTLGACCDHKGRMVANFFVFIKDKRYFLMLPENMINVTLNHLQKFAVFSRVELAQSHGLYAYWSDTAQLNENCFHIANYGFLTITSLNKPKFLDDSNAKDTSYDLSMALYDIRKGMVWLQPGTSLVFTPQMINWDRWGGVSFTKGCYVGQEIIARMHHLGKLKRHLYVGEIESTTKLNPGEDLKSSGAQTIGTLATAVRLEKNRYQFLAVIHDQYAKLSATLERV